jgi:hypothetical protein
MSGIMKVKIALTDCTYIAGAAPAISGFETVTRALTRTASRGGGD